MGRGSDGGSNWSVSELQLWDTSKNLISVGKPAVGPLPYQIMDGKVAPSEQWDAADANYSVVLPHKTGSATALMVDLGRVVILEEHGTGLRTASRRGARARDRLASVLAYLVTTRCSGPRLLRDGAAGLTVDQTSQARSAFFRHFFSPVQQVLDEGVRTGELRQMDTAFATQVLFNLVDPWTGREAAPGGRDAQQVAADVVGVVVDGIGV